MQDEPEFAETLLAKALRQTRQELAQDPDPFGLVTRNVVALQETFSTQLLCIDGRLNRFIAKQNQ